MAVFKCSICNGVVAADTGICPHCGFLLDYKLQLAAMAKSLGIRDPDTIKISSCLYEASKYTKAQAQGNALDSRAMAELIINGRVKDAFGSLPPGFFIDYNDAACQLKCSPKSFPFQLQEDTTGNQMIYGNITPRRWEPTTIDERVGLAVERTKDMLTPTKGTVIFLWFLACTGLFIYSLFHPEDWSRMTLRVIGFANFFITGSLLKGLALNLAIGVVGIIIAKLLS